MIFLIYSLYREFFDFYEHGIVELLISVVDFERVFWNPNIELGK